MRNKSQNLGIYLLPCAILLLFSPVSLIVFAAEDKLHCVINAGQELTENAVLQSNLADYNRSPPDVSVIEKRWPELGDQAPELLAVIRNPVSSILQEFIVRYSIQGEAFLIGLNGGLVAATNRTSDFDQSDEAQYIDTIGLPRGEAWIDQDLVDDSAGAILTKIALPVYLPGRKSAEKADGVLVIGVDAFVVNTIGTCDS